MGKKKIKIKFQPVKHFPELTEIGVSVNSWSYSFFVGMTDEQLRCIGIAIFRHLAKKRNKNGDQTEG